MTNDQIMSIDPMANKSSGARFLSFGFRHSFIVFFAFAALVHGAPAPSAQEILALVRMQQVQQRLDLEGQLRQDETVIPFRLTQTGPLIRYSFTNPDEVVQLRLGEKGARLDEVFDTRTENFAASKLNKKIRGTGVTYGDLALKFLYWPGGKVLGEETIRTRKCWKLQLAAPSGESQYSTVLLWIDQASGALMRLESYDSKGRLLKRFEVVSGQKIDGRWFLKQMRIEELKPGTNEVAARTYLEIKK